MEKSKIFILIIVGMLVFSNLMIVKLATADDPRHGPELPPDDPEDLPDYPKPPYWWWQNSCAENYFSKTVWDENSGTWTEHTSVPLDGSIKFKLSFCPENEIFSVWLYDYLPATVRFISASIDVYKEEKEVYFGGIPTGHGYDESTLEFYPFTKLTFLVPSVDPGEQVDIIINGKVEYLDKSYFGISEDWDYNISYQTKNVCERKHWWYKPSCGNPCSKTVRNDAEFSIVSEEPEIKIDKKVKYNCCGTYQNAITADIGEWVTFKIEVTNTGENTLYNTIVTDTIPNGLTYQTGSATPTPTNINLPTITWNLGTLNPQQTKTITFKADIELCGDWKNTATVNAHDQYQNTVTDNDNAWVNVTCEPEIKIDKKVKENCNGEWDDEITITHSDWVTYKIIIENIGENTLYGVTVTDTIPQGLTYRTDSADPEPDIINGQTLTWEFTQLNVGETKTITYRADIDKCGDWENTATVNAHDQYQDTKTATDTAIIHLECKEPCLEYDPEELDFGYMDECEQATLTFDIWNGCKGVLEYSLDWDCGWIKEVTPTSGTSTGGHDTISVSIYTAGLQWGETYNCDIYITSNDGDGIVTIIVTIGEEIKPCLEYDPESYDFGTMAEGQIDITTFDIWNGCEKTLYYNLTENIDWITLSTNTGTSTGEHNTIQVNIDTTGLTTGSHTGNIEIISNGGDGTFTVTVYIQESEQQEPTIEITRPKGNTFYFRNQEKFGFPINLTIGPITIETNATDADGEITKVQFIIDEELKDEVTEGSYNYTWNERAFGVKTIRVKAYDNDGLTAEDEITVFILNFGFTTI